MRRGVSIVTVIGTRLGLGRRCWRVQVWAMALVWTRMRLVMAVHVIVGAGAVGAATANLLAERGERVRIVSRRALP